MRRSDRRDVLGAVRFGEVVRVRLEDVRVGEERVDFEEERRADEVPDHVRPPFVPQVGREDEREDVERPPMLDPATREERSGLSAVSPDRLPRTWFSRWRTHARRSAVSMTALPFRRRRSRSRASRSRLRCRSLWPLSLWPL